MGDRGNIYFVDRREGDALAGIYMYTHWSGSMLPGIVRDALIRGRGRWGDPQYLARIVFCELIQGAVLEETGYGLGTFIGDNEHNVVRVDDLTSRVSFHEPGKEQRSSDAGLASWSFEEFVAARSAEVERAFLGEPAADLGEAQALPASKANGKAKAKAKGKGKAKGNGHAVAAPKRGEAKTKAKAAPKGKAKAKAKAGSKANGTKAPRGNGKGRAAAAAGARSPRRRAGTK
jgi:hypothetical protein